MTTAYYNEIEPFCCRVLRERMEGGDLDKGFVDERDVRTVQADELLRYQQWHLFAGIGGMPYGLRRAGIPPDFPILTAGFPCQDISLAGAGAGLEGERSGLYWEIPRIAGVLRPRWLLLENVPALRNRGADDVLLSLAEIGYAAWPFVVGADDVGAPHRRKRVWIVAFRDGEHGRAEPDSADESRARRKTRHELKRRGDGQAITARDGRREGRAESAREQGRPDAAVSGAFVADTGRTKRRQATEGRDGANRADTGWEEAADRSESRRKAMADSNGSRQHKPKGSLEEEWRWTENGGGVGQADTARELLDRRRESGAGRWLEFANEGCAGVGQADSSATQLERPGNGTCSTGEKIAMPSSVGGYEWPSGPSAIQQDWEYSRTSLPATLLNIWSRVRANYPETLRTSEQKRQAEKAFDLPLGALDSPIDGLRAKLVRNHQIASLTALGNAVVPQVVEMIGKAILTVDAQLRAEQ